MDTLHLKSAPLESLLPKNFKPPIDPAAFTGPSAPPLLPYDDLTLGNTVSFHNLNPLTKILMEENNSASKGPADFLIYVPCYSIKSASKSMVSSRVSAVYS